MRVSSFSALLVLGVLALGVLDCGGGDDNANGAKPCSKWSDCGKQQDAICDSGSCVVFSSTGGRATLDLELTLKRGAGIPTVQSLDAFVFHGVNADGAALSCAMLLGMAPTDAKLNVVRVPPGQDLLTPLTQDDQASLRIAEIPVGGNRLALVRGYAETGQGGAVIAIGCAGPVNGGSLTAGMDMQMPLVLNAP